MDVLELMKADHDEAAEILDELEELAESGDSKHVDQAAELVRRLTDTMFLHTRSEEVALYEACRGAGARTSRLAPHPRHPPRVPPPTQRARDFALQGFRQHALMSATLKELALLAPGEDGEFKACLAVYKGLFESHARVEEELHAFPMLRRAFNAEKREQMAEAMLAEKRRLQQEGPEVREEVQAPHG